MTGVEPCQCCGAELERVGGGDLETTRAVSLKDARHVADIVRFRCPGCGRGGSIRYQQGEIHSRVGPAVEMDALVKIDQRLEPSAGVNHQQVATDGGGRE